MNFSIFLLLLLPPIIITGIARFVFHKTITNQEMGIQLGICTLLIALFFAGSLFTKFADTEILTGEVTKKGQVEVHCYHPYPCNCRQVCSGSGSSRSCYTHCDTCYQHNKDWRWEVESNIGQSLYIDNIDYRGIAEPPRHKDVRIGEAFSVHHSYANYVKAASDTIFKFKNIDLSKYNVPEYPKVQDYYRVNRILVSGVKGVNVKEWNDNLNEQAKKLGISKHANPLILFTNSSSQDYRYAVEQAWEGGKKNDVLVIIGAPNYPAIEWVDTVTFGQNSGNSLLTVLMRDRIMAVQNLDAATVTKIIGSTIAEKFDKKPMKDFEYLKFSIMPSESMLWFCLALGIISSIGLSIYFHRTDTGDEIYGRYGRRYR